MTENKGTASKKSPKPEKTENKKESKDNMLAVVRIRGCVKEGRQVRDTLDKLNLRRTNNCVLVDNNPSNLGMLRKAMKYITWGPVESEMVESLVMKRGKDADGRKLDKKNASSLAKDVAKKGTKKAGVYPVFSLTPPSGGFKAVRMQYPRGDVGSRGEKINELLKRMI